MRSTSQASAAQTTEKCSKCWRPAAPGRKQCSHHLDYFRQYRQRRRTDGRCIHCGTPSSGYQLCDTCADRAAEQMRQRYSERRESGLCVACGSESSGYSLCETCASRKSDVRAAARVGKAPR